MSTTEGGRSVLSETRLTEGEEQVLRAVAHLLVRLREQETADKEEQERGRLLRLVRREYGTLWKACWLKDPEVRFYIGEEELEYVAAIEQNPGGGV